VITANKKETNNDQSQQREEKDTLIFKLFVRRSLRQKEEIEEREGR